MGFYTTKEILTFASISMHQLSELLKKASVQEPNHDFTNVFTTTPPQQQQPMYFTTQPPVSAATIPEATQPQPTPSSSSNSKSRKSCQNKNNLNMPFL